MSKSQLSDRVDAFITEIAGALDGGESRLVSIVMFGSAVTGGYETGVSDLDLLIVLEDGASAATRQRVALEISDLEARHGFRTSRESYGGFAARAVQSIARRLTASVRTFFICSKGDLLSGEPGRILGLPRVQAKFVDRIVIPSIVGSARTVWGEDLLSQIALPPVRRMDVAKAFFGLVNQILFVGAVYPLLPDATRYAMEALKRSVHSCYFCFHRQPAPLRHEVAYFVDRYGDDYALQRLLVFRGDYRKSLTFVLRCAPAITRLHVRAARDARFPFEIRRLR